MLTGIDAPMALLLSLSWLDMSLLLLLAAVIVISIGLVWAVALYVKDPTKSRQQLDKRMRKAQSYSLPFFIAGLVLLFFAS